MRKYFEPKISLGSLLGIITFVVTAGVNWGVYTNRLSTLESAQAALKVEVDGLAKDNAAEHKQISGTLAATAALMDNHLKQK